ncbi:MAG: 2'-5' RNA ligase [Alphaproteobacteria bacterium]|nr:2'-5' RNA ligase [Alphaproteobacteria bacterium]
MKAPITDRLFFAALLDPDTAGSLADLARRLRLGHELTGQPQAADRFHVTLLTTYEGQGVPDNAVTVAKALAGRVTMPPFRVVFDRALSFPGGAFVLCGGEGVAGLDLLQQKFGATQQRYEPHLTLLRDRHLVPEHPIQPVAWTVREFVLVHSLVGKTRHIHLDRWTLK